MDIQRMIPAKTLIIQFHLHLSTNKQWLADFKTLYSSSTFTNIKIPFMKFISLKQTITNFIILWNVLFCKMFRKIHRSNAFFTFDVSFFDKNITLFASSFIAILRTTNLFFFSKIRAIATLPLESQVRSWVANLTDWLIWLVHPFQFVH